MDLDSGDLGSIPQLAIKTHRVNISDILKTLLGLTQVTEDLIAHFSLSLSLSLSVCVCVCILQRFLGDELDSTQSHIVHTS